jgi:hypothetical protein
MAGFRVTERGRQGARLYRSRGDDLGAGVRGQAGVDERRAIKAPLTP